MALDLAQLRAMRKSSQSSLEKIAAAIEKQNTSNKSYQDDRFWKLEADKVGNGSAIIRFLPAREDDELPWIKMYSHGFQGPTGKWYIEDCLTTIGKEDPVVDHCNELWNSGLESDKDIARQRKRKLAYYSNILVISDPKHPENEGKVFIFKYGKKIFDKINDKLHPTFEDESPCDVFSPWEGANFRLRMRKVDGYANFDKSEFDSPTPISEDDEEMLNILNARHRLGEFLDEKNFKAYDELKKKLESVINATGGYQRKAEQAELPDEPPALKPKQEKAKAEPKARTVAEPTTGPADDVDEMEFFRGLVDEN